MRPAAITIAMLTLFVAVGSYNAMESYQTLVQTPPWVAIKSAGAFGESGCCRPQVD